jgi:hypothetical protein
MNDGRPIIEDRGEQTHYVGMFSKTTDAEVDLKSNRRMQTRAEVEA